MKTLRALLFGSVVGTLIGYLFAPRHADLLRAELMEREGQRPGAGTSGTSGTTATGASNMTSTIGTTSSRSSAGAMSGMMGAGGGVGATGAQSGPIVGNTHTKVYHQSGDDNLPEEENRTYFASPQEAEAAGYRAAGRTAEAR